MTIKKLHLTFWAITFFLVTTDLLTIMVNYRAAKDALHQSLVDRGARLETSYEAALNQTAGFMQQTATYIAHDPRVIELFKAGRDAVENGENAAPIRAKLYDLVAHGWEEMAKNDQGRLLHFHLPPAISFLRVHNPDKFGDDLSDVRHTIMASNNEGVEISGFEIGRVFVGIRGVVPVLAQDENGEDIHIGALEAGSSVGLALNKLKDILSADFAFLLNEKQINHIMLPDFLAYYTKTHPVMAGYLLEASTNKVLSVELIKNHPDIRALLDKPQTILSMVNDQPIAVTSFPVRDYQGMIDPARPAVGMMLVWSPAAQELNVFYKRLYINVLIALIGFVIVEAMLIWAIKSSQEVQNHKAMSLTDGLTGIANRRHFNLRLREEISRTRRKGGHLALMICDIDFFKQYNDYYGHLQGDKCLQQVAYTLKKELKRAGDFVARYGGEEFVVVLPGTTQEEALRLAEKMRQAVEDLHLPHKTNLASPYVTICCGVTAQRLSILEPHKGHEDELLSEADHALYKAKHDGRNRVCYYDELSEKALEKPIDL